MRLAAALAIGLLAALPTLGPTLGPTVAQDRPATEPTRDVDVTYRAMAGGKAVEQRSRFAPASGRIRIDSPSPGLYVIVNRQAQTMDMVSGGDRTVLEMPYDPARTVGGVAPERGFARLGGDSVAGTPCTEWRTEDAERRALVVCLTEDGVLLRARAGAKVIVEATKVAYGPIDPAVFAIPADYRREKGRAR